MNETDLKPHHEQIVSLYRELKEKTPPGERIGWTSYLAEHPEVREQLGLNGSTEDVTVLRNYVNDYIVRKEPGRTERLRARGFVASKVRGYLVQMRQHHDFLKRIYEENKGHYKRFQWNKLFREHPEYLEQLGLPPLDEKDDPSHSYASKVCTTYIGNYINKKPSVLKREKKRVPPSRTPEYQRAYSKKWYATKKALKELSAKTQETIQAKGPTQFVDVPSATTSVTAGVLDYCPNCGWKPQGGCELRISRK